MLEVNISELGLVTSGGKVVWGKYAQVASFTVDIHRYDRSRFKKKHFINIFTTQVTNNPENDGCINAVLLVNN